MAPECLCRRLAALPNAIVDGQPAFLFHAHAEELGTMNGTLYPIRSIAGNWSLQSGRCQDVVNESL